MIKNNYFFPFLMHSAHVHSIVMAHQTEILNQVLFGLMVALFCLSRID